MIAPISSDDLILWPDGHWCLRSELAEHGHKSDDYEVIAFGTLRWHLLTDETARA